MLKASCRHTQPTSSAAQPHRRLYFSESVALLGADSGAQLLPPGDAARAVLVEGSERVGHARARLILWVHVPVARTQSHALNSQQGGLGREFLLCAQVEDSAWSAPRTPAAVSDGWHDGSQRASRRTVSLPGEEGCGEGAEPGPLLPAVSSRWNQPRTVLLLDFCF